MTTTDFTDMDWHGLTRRIHWVSDNELGALDEAMADKLTTMDQVSCFWYYSETLKKYPKTRDKMNAVVLEYLNGDQLGHYTYNLANLIDCYTDQVKDKVVELYLGGKGGAGSKIGEFVQLNSPYCLTLLPQCIGQYQRKSYWYRAVCRVFECLRPADLDAGCKLLAAGSSKIQALLLRRQDIGEQYVVIGLKALGKLKTPKAVRTKINPDLLRRLGPKNRLDVIKRLTGSTGRFRYSRMLIEFDPVPTKEELSELLFSCSMKYYDQVVKVIEHYDLYLARLKAKETEL